MSAMDPVPSPVRLSAVAAPGQPEPTPALEQLYLGFEQEMLVPLWTQIGDLMPPHPQSKASAHLWRWDRLVPLADEAGRIVPVGRGGERRAIALANPSLGGRPFATPTLWAAIQYLMPGEDAPEHRHTQHAFRFIVEGEGVWTVVNGDSVRMSRGDFPHLLRQAVAGHQHRLGPGAAPGQGGLDQAGHLGGAGEHHPGHPGIGRQGGERPLVERARGRLVAPQVIAGVKRLFGEDHRPRAAGIGERRRAEPRRSPPAAARPT